MTDGTVQPEDAQSQETERPKRRRRPWLWAAVTVGVLLVLLAVAAGVVRYGARTDYGRARIVDVADGLKIGRFGRLQVSGVTGDVFDEFRIARVAIVDQDGVWLEGRDVAVDWTFGDLVRRRFHAERITAGLVRVLRQPNPEPPTGEPEKPLPVTVDIDTARLRLETLPALSRRRGLFDVSASVELGRTGPWTGRVNAASLLRQGDGLDAVFRLKDRDRFQVRANAVEVGGGAIAGMLGLPENDPFRLTARAEGGEAGGEVFLLARSGDRTPAEAQGRWSKAGGSVQGRLALAASRLTQPYAGWLGPELTFDVTGRGTGEDRYALQLRAAAENARLTASGPVNSAERTTSGLQARLEVDDLSRIVPNPQAGATLLAGTLRGGLDDLVFEGDGRVADLVTPQYRLASVSGPLRIERRRGDINIEADLKGAGGAGQGLLTALFGSTPTAEGRISRLADGRILIRSLNARGAGLNVQAEGSRGLLGDLSFRGRAALSNLAAARPGASGALEGSWSARNRGGREPWTFTVDATGERFGTGYPEIDRLLGPRPRLRAEAEYALNGDVRVESADLDGAAAGVEARGTLLRTGALDFDLDWRANGPFQAGPVQISGPVRGDGAIGGTLTTPRADLAANFQQIDFDQLVLQPARLQLTFVNTPAGPDGRFALTGQSNYGPASASSGFRFVTGGLDLTDIALNAGGVQAEGRISLRNGAPSAADLTVAAGPGAFLTQGRLNGTLQLVDGPGEPRAVLQVQGADIIARAAPNNPIERVRLSAAGPLDRLPFQMSLAAPQPQPVQFDGSGVFSRVENRTTVSLSGRGEARDIAFSTLEPVVVNIAPGSRSVRGRLSVGGGQAFVEGRQSGDTVNALATLERVEISTFSPDFAGRANARLTLTGEGRRLTGALNAVLDNARSLDAPENLAVDGRIQANLIDSRLQVAASAVNAAGLRAQTNVDLPVEASAQPLRLAVNRTQPIRGTFSANGELRSLWDLFFGSERSLSGRVTASGTIGGTLNNPQARGQANVTGGAFRDAATGLELEDLTLAADLAGTSVQVRQLTANDGGRGTINGQGRIGLTRGSASTFRVELSRFQFLDSELGEARASGAINVARNERGENALTGTLRVDEAEIAANPPGPPGVVTIDVTEVNVPAALARTRRQNGGAASGASGPAIALDLTITAPNEIFVRGRGLDLELSLDAQVRGTTAAPALSGVARVVRGTFEFAGKRFVFDDRGTVRLATQPENIRLDLTAVREDEDLTARVRATGTAAEPIVTLSSTPQLPQDEILAQVLFGRSASQLQPLEAAQLAAALASLSGGGGLDVIGNLRSFAGLDRLSIVGGAAGTAVAGGKYLTDDVYLELIGGGREGPVAEVDWRVRRNISVVSRVGGEQGTRVSVRYRRNLD